MISLFSVVYEVLLREAGVSIRFLASLICSVSKCYSRESRSWVFAQCPMAIEFRLQNNKRDKKVRRRNPEVKKRWQKMEYVKKVTTHFAQITLVYKRTCMLYTRTLNANAIPCAVQK